MNNLWQFVIIRDKKNCSMIFYDFFDGESSMIS